MSRPTGQTLQLLNGVVARLNEHLGRELVAELFPDNPKNYRLNHPVGAVLVAFGSSKFGNSEALDAELLGRNIVLALTLMFRQLNGPTGVIDYLDVVRDCLTGWRPPHCELAMAPVDEVFIGQANGVWQYTQRYATRTTQLQQMGAESGPLLTVATFEEAP